MGIDCEEGGRLILFWEDGREVGSIGEEVVAGYQLLEALESVE